MQKSQSKDLKKKPVTELANVAELGRATPVTIVHNVQLQNQDQQANTYTSTNAAAYDSFESDDDADVQNVELTTAPEQGIYPNVNTYDQNQETQGNYPEGTYTYYQDQNTALQQEYTDEEGEVKYNLVTENSNDVSESDYIKQELEAS